jgi:hypothetical protein
VQSSDVRQSLCVTYPGGMELFGSVLLQVVFLIVLTVYMYISKRMMMIIIIYAFILTVN